MDGRRNFFRKTVQLLMLGGLAGSAVFLTSRNGVADSCAASQQCQRCGKLNRCELEKANSFRNEKEIKGNNE